jgi:predicted 2-oxoglutarate/Fe(II)-dependent dioxygenase YbiX
MTDQEKSHTIFSLEDPFFEKYKNPFGTISLNKIPYDFSIKPVKGKLVIWDSSLFHRISPVLEQNTRYTLAFNTWMTGNISSDRSANLISNVVDVAQQHQ